MPPRKSKGGVKRGRNEGEGPPPLPAGLAKALENEKTKTLDKKISGNIHPTTNMIPFTKEEIVNKVVWVRFKQGGGFKFYKGEVREYTPGRKVKDNEGPHFLHFFADGAEEWQALEKQIVIWDKDTVTGEGSRWKDDVKGLDIDTTKGTVDAVDAAENEDDEKEEANVQAAAPAEPMEVEEEQKVEHPASSVPHVAETQREPLVLDEQEQPEDDKPAAKKQRTMDSIKEDKEDKKVKVEQAPAAIKALDTAEPPGVVQKPSLSLPSGAPKLTSPISPPPPPSNKKPEPSKKHAEEAAPQLPSRQTAATSQQVKKPTTLAERLRAAHQQYANTLSNYNKALKKQAEELDRLTMELKNTKGEVEQAQALKVASHYVDLYWGNNGAFVKHTDIPGIAATARLAEALEKERKSKSGTASAGAPAWARWQQSKQKSGGQLPRVVPASRPHQQQGAPASTKPTLPQPSMPAPIVAPKRQDEQAPEQPKHRPLYQSTGDAYRDKAVNLLAVSLVTPMSNIDLALEMEAILYTSYCKNLGLKEPGDEYLQVLARIWECLDPKSEKCRPLLRYMLLTGLIRPGEMVALKLEDLHKKEEEAKAHMINSSPGWLQMKLHQYVQSWPPKTDDDARGGGGEGGRGEVKPVANDNDDDMDLT